MKYQIVFPLAVLQALNLFWYYLILRILGRWVHYFFGFEGGGLMIVSVVSALMAAGVDDARSEDEDDGNDVEVKED